MHYYVGKHTTCFKYREAHLSIVPTSLRVYPFKSIIVIIVIITILPTFPYSMDMRRGGATESE